MRLLQLERSFYQEQRDKCFELCQNIKELLEQLLYCDKDKEIYRFLDKDLISEIKKMINCISKLEKIESNNVGLDKTKQIIDNI